MTEPTTIRGINEAQKAQHHPERNNERVCSYCFRIHPCDDFNRAVAALDLLDNSKIIADVEGIKRIVLEPDPAPRRQGPGQICECGHTLGCDCHKCQLCVRDTAVQHLEGGPSMFGADPND